MLSDIVEHDTPAALAPLIDRICAQDEPWGVAVIRRDFLRPMTNEAFVLSIRAIMVNGAEIAHVFYINDKNITVVWQGKQKSTYLNLRAYVGSTLVQQGVNVEPSVLMSYVDPRAKAEDLKASLRAIKIEAAGSVEQDDLGDVPDDGFEAVNQGFNQDPALKASQEQVELFREISSQKPYRAQLQLLVVEDQIFSQKLLCEILRGVRMRNNNESPGIDAVQGIHDGWKIFLKKAPDIIFIDLNLPDGSGHTLARAIKELDPRSRVIIVTANNYEEELGVARQNNVDSFIAKPYNKKQILTCVDSYINSCKNNGRGALRGSTDTFR